jgi:Protein of unknown function (DUF3293)
VSDPHSHRQAYLETIYHAHGVAFTLSDEPTQTRLFEGRAFTLITNANPRSVPLNDTENAARNRTMRCELERLNLTFGPSLGTNVAGTWREEGFIIWDTPHDVTLEIGHRYEQNAIIFGRGDRIALGWCDDQRLEWMYARIHTKERNS